MEQPRTDTGAGRFFLRLLPRGWYGVLRCYPLSLCNRQRIRRRADSISDGFGGEGEEPLRVCPLLSL